MHFSAAVSQIFKSYFSELTFRPLGITPYRATVGSRAISWWKTSLRALNISPREYMGVIEGVCSTIPPAWARMWLTHSRYYSWHSEKSNNYFPLKFPPCIWTCDQVCLTAHLLPSFLRYDHIYFRLLWFICREFCVWNCRQKYDIIYYWLFFLISISRLYFY